MVPLAIILIGAGLACLGYVGFSLLQSGRRPASAYGPAGTRPEPSVLNERAVEPAPRMPSGFAAGAPAGRPATYSDAYARAPETGSPVAGMQSEPPEQAAPQARASLERAPANSANAESHAELSLLRDRLTGLQRIDPDSLNEALRVFEKTERTTPEPTPQLVVTGILYLDHGRRIPGQLGRSGEIPARVFAELRRIGNGTLILENSSFLIHCGNASYSYSAGDMDQILFQGSGLALVPIHPDRPIPVFLTRDVARVKAYIKKNARIRAL